LREKPQDITTCVRTSCTIGLADNRKKSGPFSFVTNDMTERGKIVPAGPVEAYPATEDLLQWMERQFQCFGSIYKASIYGVPAYVTRVPQHAQHVFVANWRNYPKGQLIRRVGLLLGNSLMVSEGELWRRQRRMIQPAFHRTVIGGLCVMMTKANLALGDRWQQAACKRETINVTRDVGHMVLAVMLEAIFGDDTNQAAPHFAILADYPARDIAFAQAFRSLWRIVRRIVAQRRTAGTTPTDILGLLMQARDRDTGQGMSERHLINEVMTLIVAGHETTASTLGWVWYEISRAPAVERKLADELDALPQYQNSSIDELVKFTYSRQIIEEILRLYPAGWLLTRKALQDDYLDNYFVPAGAEIYISPYFIQRHPALWHDPDRFNPERFAPDRLADQRPFAMLPFSAGPRNCLGEVFARVEMQLHLMTIARRLRLRPVETGPINFAAGVNLRSKYEFLMIPELREQS
jgi:cytochrome P450